MNTFANIDSNRIASKKQIWAVANHFATLQATVPSERYGLTKVFNAILNKHHADQDDRWDKAAQDHDRYATTRLRA